ncbi:MAG: ATP-dependent protease, partial [Geobacter sp.]
LSALSGLPLKQGIAVTGAVNQHGEVLPVGGINEKIEGWFRVCATAGLDGSQGVLIPARNRRHLMLTPSLVDAVAEGRFHIHAAEQVSEGIELLTGLPAGELNASRRYPHASVLGHAQETLQAYSHACRAAEHPARKPARAGHPPPRR